MNFVLSLQFLHQLLYVERQPSIMKSQGESILMSPLILSRRFIATIIGDLYFVEIFKKMLVQAIKICCCCCCGEISQACRTVLGRRRMAKIAYLVLVLLFAGPMIVGSYVIDLLVGFGLARMGVLELCSLGLLLNFWGMAALMACGGKIARVVNDGLWIVKYIFMWAVVIVSAFVGIGKGYGIAAAFIAVGFIPIEGVVLIDLFYIFGRALVKRYQEGQEQCGGILVGFSVIFYGGSVVLNVLGYHFSDQCGSSLWLNVSISVMMILLPAVQLLQLNPQNNLLTTSLTLLLISYLGYSAQLSGGDQCRSRLSMNSYIFDIAISLILFILATYGSIYGGFSGDKQLQEASNARNLTSEQQDEEENERDDSVWVRWHFYMGLGSLYLGTLFSNWNVIEVVGRDLSGSQLSFWAKGGGSIGIGLIYIWTMIAPSLLTSREFPNA